MPVVHQVDSLYGRELAKWEQHDTKYTDRDNGIPPGNDARARGHQSYPKMLYKAEKREDGRIICVESEPVSYLFTNADEWNRACARVTAGNAARTRIVSSEGEQIQAEKQGWVAGGPDAAIAALKKFDDDIAEAAAIANKQAARMTEKAQRERAKREAATDEHIPE